MNRYVIILIVLLGQNLFSQENFNFVIDGVKVEFNIDIEDESITETIVIENLSSESIFIPSMKNKEYFFFSLGDRLHSYTGILNSITGAPNLGGQIQLIEIASKESFNMKVKVKIEKPIEQFSFGFDFLSIKDKKLIDKKNEKLWIDTLDYVKVARHFYHKQK